MAFYQPDEDESIDDLRAQATVLAFGKTRSARVTAIRILRQVVDRGISTPDDQYRLCQLYEADGDWPAAHRQIRLLLATNGTNPLYLAEACRSLLRRGLTDEAQVWFDKLEKLEPGADRTVELKARPLKVGSGR